MRILLVNNHCFISGGGDVVLYSEKKYLESCGHEVFIYGWGEVASEEGNIIICQESKSVMLRHLNKFGFPRKKRLHFKETLKRISPDIIHIHLISNYPMAVYPVLNGYKVIQTLHGPNLFCATSWGCIKRTSEPCPMKTGLKCYRNKCVSLPTVLLYAFLNARLKKYLKHNIAYWHCPSRNIYYTAFNLGYKELVYIPLGIDESYSLNKQYSNNTKEQIILFVGAISQAKGIDYLYEAFKIVLNRLPSAKLIVAGGGSYLSDFKNKVSLDHLEESVEILGRVPHEEIRNVYKKATVFAMPSIWQEQFGMVGPEALAMGIPVVGSNIGGIPEWLHHNEWGYLVTPRDTNKLAERLYSLLINPDLSYKMGQRGRNFVIQEYPYSNYVQRLELLIRALYEGNDYRDNY